MKAFLTNEWMLENRVHKKFIFKKKYLHRKFGQKTSTKLTIIINLFSGNKWDENIDECLFALFICLTVLHISVILK